MSHTIIHETLPVGALQCNCHILGDSETHEAIVLDPGDEVERVMAVLRKHKLKVRAIVSTHAHIDHVGGLHKLQQATGAPVLMHADDLELYRHLDVQAAWLGIAPPAIARVDQLIREGDAVRWGNYAANILHTPGHTPGSISLYLPVSPDQVVAAAGARGRVFAGDTLFAGGIGRTDLWGGSFEDIINSIQGKLMVLPDETLVYPGHGLPTTIGEERDYNPFVGRGSR